MEPSGAAMVCVYPHVLRICVYRRVLQVTTLDDAVHAAASMQRAGSKLDASLLADLPLLELGSAELDDAATLAEQGQVPLSMLTALAQRAAAAAAQEAAAAAAQQAWATMSLG